MRRRITTLEKATFGLGRNCDVNINTTITGYIYVYAPCVTHDVWIVTYTCVLNCLRHAQCQLELGIGLKAWKDKLCDDIIDTEPKFN